MFDWKAVKDSPIRDSFAQQKDYVNLEFEKRLQQSTLNLNEQGLNVALYWANPDPRKYVNIVPTSAITGEGAYLLRQGTTQGLGRSVMCAVCFLEVIGFTGRSPRAKNTLDARPLDTKI